jgi:hypothetical protein
VWWPTLSELHALQERERRRGRSPCEQLVNTAVLAHHHPVVEAVPDLASRAPAARFARPDLQHSGDASF